MSVLLEDNPSTSITATLINALSQSQALVQQLEEQSRTIDRLKRENEQLQWELESLRATKAVSGETEPISEQLVDQFFRKDAERQAEIDGLKKLLRAVRVKERKWRAQNPQISSPMISSDDIGTVSSSSPQKSPLRSPLQLPVNHLSRDRSGSPLTNSNVQQHSSPPRKRPRAGSVNDGPLHELANDQKANRKVRNIGKHRANRGAEAIPIVTEDGEDHNKKDDGKTKEHNQSEMRDMGAHRRLDALLSTPSPGNSVLARLEQRSSKSSSPVAKTIRIPALRKSSSDLARDAATPQERPGIRFLPPKRCPARGPEDYELLRSRPPSRLNLSNFKLNPCVNNGYDFAFDETVRNKEDRRCLPGCIRTECCGGQMEALAATLGPHATLSDDDLLIYLLGPGSEDRIRALTSVARANLLHEAQAKRIANTYGKMHRNLHERAQSPTDFWNADMPGTQEEEKNREEAKRREREEVEKRYREACKQGGKWVFADE